ncbi:MAG: MoaD/ThiS family protein [Firmicutes bacterium]|nr:MoaD/ThiS family protein [Bacillota bacterium]
MVTIEFPESLSDLTGIRQVQIETGSRAAENEELLDWNPESGRTATVESVFRSLKEKYPSLYHKVFMETGGIRPHLLIFVNDVNIRDRQGIKTPLVGCEKIYILPAVSGG